MTFLLSAGNDYDSTHTIQLLEQANIRGSNVLAGRAYEVLPIRAYISEYEASYVLPKQTFWPSSQWTATYTRSVIRLNVSSRKLNGFVELPPGTTS